MAVKTMLDTPRRRFILGGAALTAFTLAGCGQSQETASVDVDERMDHVLGNPDAPVTMIEYASLTCGHCKAFHDQVYPAFKSRYVDTGKVRFVYREMPTSPYPLSMACFLVARAVPEDKYFDLVDIMYERQTALIQAYQAGTAREELLKIVRPLGISESEFDACVRDTIEVERIEQIAEGGVRRYNVSGTPTFIIDGKSYDAMPIDQLAAILDPLIEAG
jgi:protein-disulfide isomerase